MLKQRSILPSQAELQEIFEYNIYTGLLRRKDKLNQKNAGEWITTQHHTGYYTCCIKNKSYSIHNIIPKLILDIDLPEETIIDHINVVKTNNRLENLRMVTYAENNWNNYINNTVCENIVKKPNRSCYVTMRSIPDIFLNEMTKYTNHNKYYSKYMSYDKCVELRERIKDYFREHLSKIPTLLDLYNEKMSQLN
jgi:hypothetical protein